jgi:hypothetical protein
MDLRTYQCAKATVWQCGGAYSEVNSGKCLLGLKADNERLRFNKLVSGSPNGEISPRTTDDGAFHD